MIQTKIDFDTKATAFTLEDIDTSTNIKAHVTFIDTQKTLYLLEEWLVWDHKILSIDIETTGLDPHTGNIIMFQIGDLERQFVVDVRSVDISGLLPLIFNDEITLLGTNLKFEYKWLKVHYGVVLDKIIDVMLQETILHQGLDITKSLKDMSFRYLGYVADKTIRMRFLTIGDEPFSKDEILYGAYDVILPYMIHNKQLPKIKEYELHITVDIESRFMPVLGDMEIRGLKLNQDKWLALYNDNLPKYTNSIKELDKFILDNNIGTFIDNQYDLFSDSFSTTIKWSSTKQVIQLFVELGICPRAISKQTGKEEYSVDATVIKASLNGMNKDTSEVNKQLIGKYLEMKKYSQRINTFGIKYLEKYINPKTKRVHTNFRQIINTGRSASSNPNVQQIPHDKEYRMCFDAPEGYKIVNCDFSGQENVITADKSQDENMLHLLNTGGDSHCLVARYAFPELKDLSDKEIKNNYSDKRGEAKAAGFACAYGGNGFTISKNLGISEAAGELVYEGYFKAYPGLKKYFDDVEEQTIRDGYITINNISKRKRFLPMYDRYVKYSKDPTKFKQAAKLKAKIRRLAMNSPTQGTAADQTKVAGILFRNWIYESNYQDKVFLVLAVHDELSAESPEDMAEEVAKMLEKCMISAGNKFLTKVEMKAEAVISDYWTH